MTRDEWEAAVLAAADAVADAWQALKAEAAPGHYWRWMDAINAQAELAQQRPVEGA